MRTSPWVRACSGPKRASCGRRSSPRLSRSRRKCGNHERSEYKTCADGDSPRRHREGDGGPFEGAHGQGACREPVEADGYRGARKHHQAAYAAESLKERSRRDSRQRRADSRVECDADLSKLRKAYAGGPYDVAGRHKSAKLPALQYDDRELIRGEKKCRAVCTRDIGKKQCRRW